MGLKKNTSIELSENLNKQEIIELFKSRCVRCQRPASTVHECEPRSQGKDSMKLKNRVPICTDCHGWAHRVGTLVSAPILLNYRSLRLRQYYGDNRQSRE